MNDVTFVAKRITELRLSKNISSRKLSLDLGLSNSYITQIENGNKLPSLDNLFKICDYFRISISDFFNSSSITPEIRNLLDTIRDLTPGQLELLSKFIQSLK
ncbi:helix-turn-helix domain-containing protein [Clostridium sp.]|jgi:transcriptional regulator with XRE-family HTH domain|uniref:helix-turn-helix domain-containing protein n=1 Tax=Clostridium sp. TaxID=1506 RepID=UPI002FDED706